MLPSVIATEYRSKLRLVLILGAQKRPFHFKKWYFFRNKLRNPGWHGSCGKG